MPFVRDLGIRARLVLLTAAAVMPLVLLLGAGLAFSYGDAIERAKADVRQSAEIAAARLAGTFQDARARLDVVRNLAEARRSSGPVCDAFLTALQKSNPQFARIGMVGRDGAMICSGQLGGTFILDDRAAIDRTLAMAPGGFTIGTFATGLADGQPTVLAAMPLSHVRGEAAGIIYAAIRLDHLLDSVRMLGDDGERSVVLLEASTSRILARWPDPVPFGSSLQDHPALAYARDRPEGGAVELTDLDGTPRIFGAAPVEEAGSSSIMVLVGEARAARIAPVNTRGLLALLLALLALALAIGAASSMGSAMLVRPMRRLVKMASLVGAGEFGARTRMEAWQAPEFRELAVTLDGMAVHFEEGREAEKAVAASEARYRLLAENTADMVTCVDASGERTFVSGACQRLLGYAPEELLGEKPCEIAHPEDAHKLTELARGLREGGMPDAVRYRARHRDGHYVWVEATGRRIEGRSELVFAVRDASHRKAMEDHLEAVNHRLASLAATDDLTNLPNRRFFNGALANELARCTRSGAPLGLLLIDVDRFKAFNDGYGHQAGDVCLKEVAKALGLQVGRPRDLVARYGGEEFVAILPEATLAGARARAEMMRLAVRDLCIDHAGSEHGRVTISIGVACLIDARSEDATEILLRQADQALYAAKAQGRDRVEVFSDKVQALMARQSA